MYSVQPEEKRKPQISYKVFDLKGRPDYSMYYCIVAQDMLG